ncbi:MAG: hypothetical protein U0802_03115 [Candidatus Binatia bacterium]
MSGGELLVVALGGNAVSPPRGAPSFAVERQLIGRAATELAPLARAGARLLVVHGNGPQVGRLLATEGRRSGRPRPAGGADRRASSVTCSSRRWTPPRRRRACVAVITRVVVAPDDAGFATPTKPVGRVLASAPAAPAIRVGDGWRRVVASPRPLDVLELGRSAACWRPRTWSPAAAAGSPSPPARRARRSWTRTGPPRCWRRGSSARRLLYVTDVDAVYDDFGGADARRLSRLSVAEARARVAAADFPAGSMGPKVASATAFVAASGCPAVITTLGAVAAALAGAAGTTIS